MCRPIPSLDPRSQELTDFLTGLYDLAERLGASGAAGPRPRTGPSSVPGGTKPRPAYDAEPIAGYLRTLYDLALERGDKEEAQEIANRLLTGRGRPTR